MRFDVIFSADALVTACVSVDADNQSSAAERAERQEKDWEIQSLRHVEIIDVLTDGIPNRKRKHDE
jgi:hypothetical protein